MAEYIDREDLAKHLDILYNRLCGKSPYFYCGFQAAVDYVKEFSAADVAPVVHGRWDSLDGYKTRRVCSVCGWDVPEYGKFYSYCPNCGAKMDGGDNTER